MDSLFSFIERTPDCTDRTGFVYLVKASATSFYKIGKSRKPYKRLSALQVGSPLELIICERVFSLDCVQLESSLHSYYEAYWLRGEWFDLADECVKEFLQVANDIDRDSEIVSLQQGSIEV